MNAQLLFNSLDDNERTALFLLLASLDVAYTIHVSEDDTPIRGNALASGNSDIDRECEEAIIRRLNNGDVWAWAFVRVTAQAIVNGVLYTGEDCLGGCSYKNEADFKQPGDYYDDMKHVALENLKAAIQKGTNA